MCRNGNDESNLAKNTILVKDSDVIDGEGRTTY